MFLPGLVNADPVAGAFLSDEATVAYMKLCALEVFLNVCVFWGAE